MRNVIVLFFITLLFGCATTGNQTEPAPEESVVAQEGSAPQFVVAEAQPTNTQHVVCREHRQADCWDILVLNALYEEGNPLYSVLEYTDEATRQDLVDNLAPRVLEAYRTGGAKPAKPRDFVVMLWNVNNVPASNLNSFHINPMEGSDVTTTSREVRELVLAPGSAPVVDVSASDLGEPDQIYQIRSDGIGASIQVPVSMLTRDTQILVCSTDALSVYPFGGDANTPKKGLWINATRTSYYLENRARDGKNGVVIPFISRE